MARQDLLAVRRQFRDPPLPAVRRPQVLLRVISVAWASIGRGDLMEGELVFNDNDNSLVERLGDNTIYRYDSVATRTI